MWIYIECMTRYCSSCGGRAGTDQTSLTDVWILVVSVVSVGSALTLLLFLSRTPLGASLDDQSASPNRGKRLSACIAHMLPQPVRAPVTSSFSVNISEDWRYLPYITMVTFLGGFCNLSTFVHCAFVWTGALRNGCSFEDDLLLGAEGQYPKEVTILIR